MAQLPATGATEYRAHVHIRVLGPVEAVGSDGHVALGGPKQRTAFALLAAEAGKVVSADALIEGLWGDEPAPRARSTLYTYISNLRHELGDVIVREGHGYRLDVDPRDVDAVEFEQAVARAAEIVETAPAEASQELRAALALWRGHPYADVADSLRLELEASRLEELRLVAVETRIDAELPLGRHVELVPELEVLSAEFPLREAFRAQHMLALYRSGRQVEALRSFQKTRTYLADELGLEPSARLRDLERRILTQDASLQLATEPRVESLAFLLMDIEESTALWETRTAAMRLAVAEHDRIVREAVERAGGRIIKRVGDGVDTAFSDVTAAVQAAEEIQRGLAAQSWGETGPLLVRMAVDFGEAEARDGDYFGPVLNRAGRMCAAGHGGQVLLSADAHADLATSGSVWQAKALGEFRFKGIGTPQHVFQLLIEGLRTDFPPLRIDRAPVHPQAGFGRAVRGYELREQVGRGAFGIVYRAYQPSVGREVAIKVVHIELVNEPSFVRDFEADARAVAQLEHPHIVSLYDYWRDPDGAYLVTRWLRGGSLERALERGAWSLEPATRLLAHVAGALSYAHRLGIAHGNAGPANVLLDDEGHAYVSDFAIARDAEEPASLASDLHRLTLLAFELLSGKRPDANGALPSLCDLRPELPSALDAVFAKATAADTTERYASADDFLAAFIEAAGPGAAPAEIYTPAENPYKGLRAFGESDTEDFYGRDPLVAELVNAVGEHRLVAVVGPSGIGKSSVVRAGLIPALRRGALPGSEGWVVSDMFPGSYPYEELAAALLRVAVERPDELVDELARDELGLARVTKQILPRESELLLVVDQFEELFTLTPDEETRRRFLAGLTQLVTDSRSRARVVVTMRADFLDHPLGYPEFGELLKAGMVAVTIPSQDELAEAVEGPAARVGVGFEPGLVSQIVGDVQDEPGALPLLQYALTELFAARASDVLTLEGYVATGGVVGALGRRAEELFLGLDRPAQAAARQVFLRLVSVDPQGQDTRRRVRRRELRSLEFEPAAMDEILGRYGEHRLLTFDREPLTRSPTVEVAHEALLRQWQRLRGWVDERREDLLLHRRLAEAVDEWEETGRQPDYLPRESRLGQLEAWAGETDIALTAGERDFLAEARTAADAASRRRARRRRGLLAGFAALAVATSVAAVFAFILRSQAEDEARLSKARQLAASAQANLDVDPELSILLGIEAVETTRRADGTVLREAEEALHEALGRSRTLATVPGAGGAVALAPDGHRIASADGKSDVVRLWDLRTRKNAFTLSGHTASARAVDYSPDGRRVATGSLDGTARIWDARTGSELLVLRGHRGPVLWVWFSPDGDRLATIGDDRTARVWDARTGAQVRSFRVSKGDRSIARDFVWGNGLAFLPEGRLLVGLVLPEVQQDATIETVARIVDVATSRVVSTIEHPTLKPHTVDASPDGSLVAAANTLGTLVIWRNGEQLTEVAAHTNTVMDIEFTADGTRFATADSVGTTKVWEVTPGGVREAFVLAGHIDTAPRAAFSPDGNRLLTGSRDGTARLWDSSSIGPGELLALPGPEADLLGEVDFRPDGRRLVASSGPEGTVRAWDVSTGREVFERRGHRGILFGVDVSADGRRVVTTSADGTARVWDAASGRATATFGGHCAKCWVVDAEFSPDGSRVASVDLEGTVRIWGSSSAEQLKVLRGETSGYCCTVDWNRDGTRVVAPSGDGVIVWDVATGRKAIVRRHSGEPLASAAFSPDGTRFATLGSSNDLRIWDAGDGRQLLRVTTGRGGGFGLRWRPDGTHVAVGLLDGTIKVFDAETGDETLVLRGSSFDLAFSPDGTLLAGSRPQPAAAVKVYALDVERLLEVARARVTRSLTDEECRQYLQRACS